MRYSLFFKVLFISLFVYQGNCFSQNWLSSNFFNGEGAVSPIGVASDGEGSIYVYGYFDQTVEIDGNQYNSTGGRDLFLSKFSSDNQLLWLIPFGSSSSEYVDGGITINDDNIVYLTGGFRSTIFFNEEDSLISEGGFDSFLSAFTQTGELLWAKKIVTGSGNQRPNDIAVDQDQNILVSGFFSTNANIGTDVLIDEDVYNDIFIARFDKNGNYINAKQYSVKNSVARIFDINTSSDKFFLTGIFSDTLILDSDTIVSVNSTYDAFIYAIDNNLDGDWVRTVSGFGDEYLYSVNNFMDSTSLITGYSNSTNIQFDSTENEKASVLESHGGFDIFNARYDKNGNLLNKNNYGGISDEISYKNYVGDNKIHLTGYITGNSIWGKDTLKTFSVDDKAFLYSELNKELNVEKARMINSKIETSNERAQGLVKIGEKVFMLGTSDADSININGKTYVNLGKGKEKTFLVEYGCIPIFLTTQTSTPLPCNTLNGGDSAQISLSAEGGFTELLYSIDGGQNFSADTFFYVNTPGEYPVVVQDSTGCQILGDTIIITQPDVLEITGIDSADASSQGAADGSIIVLVEGGTKPYSYSLNGGAPQADSVFTGLAQGKYKLVIQDANNCGPLETDSITIGPPPCEPISFISQTASDFACNLGGEDSVMINLEAEGGLTGLLYSIDGGLSFAADGEFYVKQAGEYEVVVQDSTGCELLGDTLIVSQPELFTITDIDSSDASARDVSDGSIVVTVTGGTEPYEFTLNGGTPQANGGFTGLAPGKYKLSVQDANSCGPLETDSITIGPRSCVPISLVSLDYSDLSCHENNGGEPAPISIEAEGGLTGLLYSIDGGDTFAPDGEFAVGLPGEYIVMAKDSTGCEEIFDTITISQPEEFDITSIYSSDVNHHGGNEGFVLVNVVGGTLPYVFTLNGGSEQSTGSYMDLTAGKYQVQVVDDNNCGPLETDSIIIEQPPVGLKDLGVKQVNIYPNPVNEELNIEFKIQDKEEESISIMDASGKVVVNKKFKAVNGKVSERLGVSGLRNGVYFLRIGDGGEVLKIVKE